jgi:HAD superfamily hydrolase (TIGR01509 family)
MVQHIIFDCDGVLIDTEIVAAEVVSAYLRSEGTDISTEQFIAEFTGKTFTDIINLLKQSQRLRPDVDTATVVPRLDDTIRENQRPINGAVKMIQSLSLPFSVVSNSAKDYVIEALEKLEVYHLVEERVFSAEQVAQGKPSPLVYELAVQHIGLSKQQLIVVEDSSAGVMASRAADLKTIGFLGGSHIRQGHDEKLLSLGVHQNAKDHADLSQLLSKASTY